MIRSTVGLLYCLWVLLSSTGFAGCGGTETGNPAGPGGGGGGNAAITLGEEVCERLTSCFGADRDFTAEDCVEAINDSETLGPAFGVDEVPPPGYGQVIDKVDSSELSAYEDDVEACVQAIESLDCEDPAVRVVDIEDGFTNVEEMIPEESCSDVFFVP